MELSHSLMADRSSLALVFRAISQQTFGLGLRLPDHRGKSGARTSLTHEVHSVNGMRPRHGPFPGHDVRVEWVVEGDAEQGAGVGDGPCDRCRFVCDRPV